MSSMKEMGQMLPKEIRKLHEERHEISIKEARARFGNSDGIQYSEAVWENTLNELTGGEYDSVLGLRLFVAELLAKNDRQAFIDQAATRLCVIARSGTTSKSEIEGYARVAYDQAEALWRERQARRNRGTDQDIPF